MTERHPDNKTVPLKEIAKQIGAEVVGDPNLLINGVAGIKEAQKGDITFVSNTRYIEALRTTRASAVIVSKPMKDLPLAWLVVKDPYYAFCRVVTYFYQKPYQPRGIHPLASIGQDVKLGEDLSICPYVRVEDGAVIGDRVTLYPGVYVGEKAFIGDDSILYANVSIREKVKIGCRVIIHGGAVIGSDGFGFATYDGLHHKIPQVGIVVVGDDVEIGANVTVDRAALGKTVIGRGTKIDNLVQIAHNVTIGEDSLLVSQVGISGSTQLGDRVTLAGQVGLAGHLSIGDNVVVGAKSGVIRDVSSNQTVSGIYALPHRTWLEVQASLPHLPDIRKRLKVLESKLAFLEQKTMNKTRKKKSGTKGVRR
jgi:UDP-3-O-[3-hydroxymyristoyl] glucosamine N-acyltransferase